MTHLSDTSRDAEDAQIQLLRKKSPLERLMMALRLSDDVARATKLAIRRAYPNFSEVQVREMFVELSYGKELADALRKYQGSPENG